VFALYAGEMVNPTVNVLTVVILAARIMQSLVHVCLVQTNTVVTVRFGFYFVQIASFFWLIAICVAALDVDT
jgi:hypothetical protein